MFVFHGSRGSVRGETLRDLGAHRCLELLQGIIDIQCVSAVFEVFFRASKMKEWLLQILIFEKMEPANVQHFDNQQNWFTDKWYVDCYWLIFCICVLMIFE